MILILPLVLIFACGDNTTEAEMHHDRSKESHAHGDHKEHGDHHKSANEYMHQSNMDELIQRFESPERDAYP